jgi:transposase
MSTPWFYHLFGIKGYRVVSWRMVAGRRVLGLVPQRQSLRCSACGSDQVVHAGLIVRRFHSVPVGLKAVQLEVAIPRLQCHQCGVTRQIALRFADIRVSYTRAFARFVVGLARHMSLSALAKLLHVGWDLVKSIVKRYLRSRYGRPRLRDVRRIGIDEINLGRRFGFSTVVLDLDSGAVIYVGRGRDAAALDRFWRRLRPSRAKIKAVALDMAPSYRAAVQQHLPDAMLVLDRFHVVKLLNERLTKLLSSEAKAKQGRHWKVLKGLRWIVVKRRDQLRQETGEVDRLRQALAVNKRLMIAYYLKEEFERFWQQKTKEKAAAFLDDWLRIALDTSIGHLITFAESIGRYRQELLNWYDHPISTGPLESANGRIRLLQRRAYGYRDREFFTLCIYAMHDRIYA